MHTNSIPGVMPGATLPPGTDTAGYVPDTIRMGQVPMNHGINNEHVAKPQVSVIILPAWISVSRKFRRFVKKCG